MNKIHTGTLKDYDSRIYHGWTANQLGKLSHSLIHFAEGGAFFLLEALEAWRNDQYAHQRNFQAKVIKGNAPGQQPEWHSESVKRVEECTEQLFGTRTIPKESFRDKVTRYAYVAVSLFHALSTAPLTIPAAVVGFAARAYVQRHMNEFVCLQSEKAPKKWNGKSSLSCLNLNAALTESRVMNLKNKLSDSNQRAEDLGHFLVDSKADVICLQEAFDIDELVPHVAEKLQSAGYNVVIPSKRNQTLGLNSGLLFASKYPIERFHFKQFKDLRGVDARAKKGILGATLKLNNKDKINVTTAHMQGGVTLSKEEIAFSKQAAKEQLKQEGAELTEDAVKQRAQTIKEGIKVGMKMNQLFEIKQFMHAQLPHDGIREEILVGDFNVKRFRYRKGKVIPSTDYAAIQQFLQNDQGLGRWDELTGSKKTVTGSVVEIDPKKCETGEAMGTNFAVNSIWFQQFSDLVQQKIMRKWHLSESDAHEILKDYWNRTKRYKEIDPILSKLKNNRVMKPTCTDHLFIKEREEPLFSKYSYKVIVPVGAKGVLSDHGAVKVELGPGT